VVSKKVIAWRLFVRATRLQGDHKAVADATIDDSNGRPAGEFSEMRTICLPSIQETLEIS
jgi:hypothetical protein